MIKFIVKFVEKAKVYLLSLLHINLIVYFATNPKPRFVPEAIWLLGIVVNVIALMIIATVLIVKRKHTPNSL